MRSLGRDLTIVRRPHSPLVRRAQHRAVAITACTLIAVCACATSAHATGTTVQLTAYGALCNGANDDTAAFASAFAAAGSGGTVVAPTNAQCLIDTTVTVPSNETLNLEGSSVGAYSTRSGGLSSQDKYFDVTGSNSTVTNGSIGNDLSPYTGQAGSGLTFYVGGGGSGDTISNMTDANADQGTFVGAYADNSVTVTNNHITDGNIGFTGGAGDVASNNTVTAPSGNGISIVSYQGYPTSGDRVTGNTITDYGRVGIEDYGVDGGQYTTGDTVSNNTLSAAPGGETGISTVGTTGETVDHNTITNATGWGIEASGTSEEINSNTISFTSSADSANCTGIVINTQPAAGSPTLNVEDNQITGGLIGIQMYTGSGSWQSPVNIQSNTITNPIDTAITLAPAASTGLVTAQDNTLQFTVAATTNRVGISTNQDASVVGNQVTYTTASYSSGNYDIPYEFVGNGVTLSSNTSDGGGRTDGYCQSRLAGSGWSDYVFNNNTFGDGSSATIAYLSSVTGSGNRGIYDGGSNQVLT